MYPRPLQIATANSVESRNQHDFISSKPVTYPGRWLLILLFCAAYQLGMAQPLPQIFGVMQQGGKRNGGTVLNLTPGGNTVRTTADFGAPLIRPRHRNVVGSDGYLYNIAYGGNYSKGGLFRIRPDGTGYEQILDFGLPVDDALGNGGIAMGPDGVIYGTTDYGGAWRGGSVYRINGDGTRYKKLVDFPYASTPSPEPSTLLLGGDGYLYGTHFVGTTNFGNIFRLATDGTGLTEIFRLQDQQLSIPRHLHWGSDGRLYALAWMRSPNKYVLFRINADGSSFQVLHTFDEAPDGSFIEGTDGKLYGTMSSYANDNLGYLYRCDKDGTGFEIIHDFDGGINTNIFEPIRGVREHPDGFLYGIAASGGTHGNGGVYRIQRDGSAYEVVHELSIVSDKSELAIVNNDLLFFTATGGTEDKGSLYRVQQNTGSIVYNFTTDAPLAVSPGPLARAGNNQLLMRAKDIDLSGIGSLITLSSFSGEVRDVSQNATSGSGGWLSQMVDGKDGYWYWIGYFMSGTGSIVREKADGSATERIYEFSLATGNFPLWDIAIRGGYIYGTCMHGGATNGGLIYRVKTDGTGYQVLRDQQLQQAMPSLAIGPDDRIYAADNGIFSMKPDGTDYRQLRALPADRIVSAPLTIIGDQVFGVLNGSSLSGTFAGSVFNMNIDGSGYRDLHAFARTDGDAPFTALYPFRGKLYGATYRGGDNGMGTLFSVDPSSGALTTIKHLNHETGYAPSLRLVGDCLEVPTPVIAADGNTLTSNAPFGNQWYRNGVAIVGALSASLKISESGNYQVMTLFGDCPSALSPPVTATITGVEEESGRGLYPNPTSGKVVVATATKEADVVRIVITNTTGVVVMVYEGAGGDVQLDLGGSAPGLYVVSIESDGRRVQRKLAVR